jgi:hypothetical protein
MLRIQATNGSADTAVVHRLEFVTKPQTRIGLLSDKYLREKKEVCSRTDKKSNSIKNITSFGKNGQDMKSTRTHQEASPVEFSKILGTAANRNI